MTPRDFQWHERWSLFCPYDKHLILDNNETSKTIFRIINPMYRLALSTCNCIDDGDL